MEKAIDLFGGKLSVQKRFAEAIQQALTAMPFPHVARLESALNLPRENLRAIAIGKKDSHEMVTARLIEAVAEPLHLNVPQTLGKLELTHEQKQRWATRAKNQGFLYVRPTGQSGSPPHEPQYADGEQADPIKLFVILCALRDLDE